MHTHTHKNPITSSMNPRKTKQNLPSLLSGHETAAKKRAWSSSLGGVGGHSITRPALHRRTSRKEKRSGAVERIGGTTGGSVHERRDARSEEKGNALLVGKRREKGGGDSGGGKK
jgi:hypothetical protein